MSARRLGAWKTPKPAPHAAIRHATSPRLGLGLVAALPSNPSLGDVAWRMAACGAGFGVFQRGVAVRQAPGQGRHEGDRDGPGYHQEAGLELGAPSWGSVSAWVWSPRFRPTRASATSRGGWRRAEPASARPARGATRATAMVQGTIRKPASNWERPSAC
jgi:hypothetical protein